ncbi:unnamed protein product [Fraxinus pennsylvanica]|uniref:Glutaredoxin domain-containing protein n=1 Tax=Fraxinus pennsylvanica TaxID=56036 RepID=A0AAD2DM30_9LAMI|nr:unnamed protein product [Fraxinus pennsylvanica]
MQGIRHYAPLSDCRVRLELTPTTTSPLAISVAESTEMRIQRLICENPVIIFSRSSCYMCHVMKLLLSTVGVHPTIIELDEDEISVFTVHGVAGTKHHVDGEAGGVPALYIGGTSIGGLESLVALHLSGHLVSKLMEVGVLRNTMVF